MQNIYLMEFIWEYVVSSDWDMPLKVPHACLAVPSLQRQRCAWPPFRWVDEMASSSSSFINPTLKAPKTNSSSGKQTQVYSPPPVSQSIVLHHSCCFLCSDIALDTSSLLPAFGCFGVARADGWNNGIQIPSLWALATRWSSFQDYTEFCKDILCYSVHTDGQKHGQFGRRGRISISHFLMKWHSCGVRLAIGILWCVRLEKSREWNRKHKIMRYKFILLTKPRVSI